MMIHLMLIVRLLKNINRSFPSSKFDEQLEGQNQKEESKQNYDSMIQNVIAKNYDKNMQSAQISREQGEIADSSFNENFSQFQEKAAPHRKSVEMGVQTEDKN